MILKYVVVMCGFIIITANGRAYDNEIVVRIAGGPRFAKRISEEMGYHYKGLVCNQF